MLIYSLITDLYFIKRFLDKNYIESGVSYTGGTHFNNIIFILVKYFNYNITHIFKYYTTVINNKSYSIRDISNLPIKNFEYDDIMSKLFIFSNENETFQCVNFFQFPDNFE